MSFLDSQQDEAEEQGPPQGGAPPTPGGGKPPGPGQGALAGGGPILAAIAGRQRGPQVSAPGAGDQASAMTMVQQAIGLMNQALPALGTGSPVYQDVLKALQRISRHIPSGAAPGAGVQKTHLEDLLRNVVKNALLSRIMGQQQGQGGAPGGAPPGGGGQAPMPATPLPGA